MKELALFIKKFQGMLRREHEKVMAELRGIFMEGKITGEVGQGKAPGKEKRGLKCPRCGGTQIKCRRTFMEEYTRVTMWLKKWDAFKAYMYQILMGVSIRFILFDYDKFIFPFTNFIPHNREIQVFK